MNKVHNISWLVVVALLGKFVFAAPRPLELEHTIELKKFKGQTFLEAMLDRDEGIVKSLDEDYSKPYKLAGKKDVLATVKNFDKKVQKKALEEEGNLAKVADLLTGEMFAPAKLTGKIYAMLNQKDDSSDSDDDDGLSDEGDPYTYAQMIAMASGAGTLVIIDGNNYYYNYGYQKGEVKSGRSFGASPGHAANDASDIMYLGELEDYLSDATKPSHKKDERNFYETLMALLTQSDASGYSNLGEDGETLSTDFLTIYTAESYRHIQRRLDPKKNPWDNDLAEATFVSAYGVKAGKVIKSDKSNNVKFVDGSAVQWWAQNPETHRSGIGKTQPFRRALQRLITSYERKNNPKLVKAVEDLLPGEGTSTDLYEDVMEYLNNAKWLRSSQKEIEKNAEKLTDAFVDFLMQTTEDADEITGYVQKNFKTYKFKMDLKYVEPKN